MTTDSARVPIIITAVGPDNVRLADPIIHSVTGQGANIAEIQMYDHDEEALFAMLIRIQLPRGQLTEIRQALADLRCFPLKEPKLARRMMESRWIVSSLRELEATTRRIVSVDAPLVAKRRDRRILGAPIARVPIRRFACEKPRNQQ